MGTGFSGPVRAGDVEINGSVDLDRYQSWTTGIDGLEKDATWRGKRILDQAA